MLEVNIVWFPLTIQIIHSRALIYARMDVQSLRNKVADLTVVFFRHDSAFHSSKLETLFSLIRR